MKLHNPTAAVFVPDNHPVGPAMQRVTHLGIGAHQDDLEFMAFHGIVQCYGSSTKSFGGVTCTNGGSSARSGRFANFTDEQMCAERQREQNEAARLGQYGVMIQLDYPSRVVKDPGDTRLTEDLANILGTIQPEIVYTHNPADKHDTHVAVLMATVRAIRALPAHQRPDKLYGCEVWRDLDWLPDGDKVILDVTGHDALAQQLNGIFASQIAGGKRYDLAVQGRRRANATFFESHATDQSEQVCFAVDLTTAMRDDGPTISELITTYIRKFESDVHGKLTPWK